MTMTVYERYLKTPQLDLNEEFIHACKFGKIENLKCLLENKEFLSHIDVHVNEDAAFAWSLINHRREILSYLIHQYSIDRTEKINEYLGMVDEKIVKEALHMFSIRDLKDELKEDLEHKNPKDKALVKRNKV